MGIVLVFSLLNRPSQEERIAEERMRDSLQQVEDKPSKTSSITPEKDTAQIDTTVVPVGEKANYYTLENDLLKLQLSSKGGQVAYVELKNFQTYDTNKLELVKPNSSVMGFTYGNSKHSSELNFRLQKQEAGLISLQAKDGNTTITHTYSLSEDGNTVLFKSDWSGTNPQKLTWTSQIRQQELSAETERRKTAVYYKYAGEQPDNLSETSDEDDEELVEGQLKWVSFKQHFFNQTLVYENSLFPRGTVKQYWTEDDTVDIKTLHASLALRSQQSHEFKLLYVENHYTKLKKYGLSLERVIDLGWGIFGWVNRFLVIPIFNVLSGFIGNYGLIIAILTVIFKLILLFFTYKAFLSGAKMRALKPELDALKKKNDGDMQKIQMEQMQLYRETGVSPFGGCLPLFVQLPILIALFNFFPNSIELRQESFLWVKDLSTYDSIWDFGFNIPFYGDHVSLFALLMTVSTFVYTLINQSYQPAQQKELKYLPYIMPIIFLSFLNNYSAALSYYYFLANIISIGQTYLFKAFIDEKKLRAKLDENRKNKSGKSGGVGVQGRMQGWLEKQQKKQQQQAQQRAKKRK